MNKEESNKGSEEIIDPTESDVYFNGMLITSYAPKFAFFVIKFKVDGIKNILVQKCEDGNYYLPLISGILPIKIKISGDECQSFDVTGFCREIFQDIFSKVEDDDLYFQRSGFSYDICIIKVKINSNVSIREDRKDMFKFTKYKEIDEIYCLSTKYYWNQTFLNC